MEASGSETRRKTQAAAGDELCQRAQKLMIASTNEQQRADALALCQQVAEQGHAEAQYTLGTFYERGLGYEKDSRRAARWHFAAATNGHVLALQRLREGISIRPTTIRATVKLNADLRGELREPNATFQTGTIGLRNGRLRYRTRFSGTIRAIDPDGNKSVELASGMKMDEVEDAARFHGLVVEKQAAEEWKIGNKTWIFKHGQLAEIEFAPAFVFTEAARKSGRMIAFPAQTPFAEYDRTVLAAVDKQWHRLLNSASFEERPGKVVIEFHLNSDGSVSDVSVAKNEVREPLGLACRRAVEEAAPFAEWPTEMKRVIGRSFREIRFTFYYNSNDD
jgi:TonB family protein